MIPYGADDVMSNAARRARVGWMVRRLAPLRKALADRALGPAHNSEACPFCTWVR